MRWLLLVALLPVRSLAECTPAPPAAVAEAERLAADAERKAEQAESTSVRSGNRGAARRAELVRQEAAAARRKVAELSCTAAAPAPAPGPRKAGTGY